VIVGGLQPGCRPRRRFVRTPWGSGAGDFGRALRPCT